ncbi:hypothetical protein M758_1G190000 [Ceratodon purpureus]|uniref:Uncharacterized protein n=1 Tax=Ceratodon purpureus TaxID=3225 RepID=A0A8T0JB82_CERPU|nr:hypothetical protein KC19_1G233300 [Ceratodon purpureus]KAG0630587.1 hypothetical protein M758_1G190000 [Ceratodon purpureus]
MDNMYEKLSRALMRRKYEKVDRSRSVGNHRDGFVVKRKTVTVKIPKAEKGKEKVDDHGKDHVLETLPVVNPKRFTILSSGNDVVDEAWLAEALRRTLDEGRLEVLTKG